jgi:hypothetical protein
MTCRFVIQLIVYKTFVRCTGWLHPVHLTNVLRHHSMHILIFQVQEVPRESLVSQVQPARLTQLDTSLYATVKRRRFQNVHLVILSFGTDTPCCTLKEMREHITKIWVSYQTALHKCFIFAPERSLSNVLISKTGHRYSDCYFWKEGFNLTQYCFSFQPYVVFTCPTLETGLDIR